MEDLTENSSVPIYTAPISEEELLERAKWEQEAADLELAREAKEAAKVSAVAKLAKLGLTEDEAKAIVGI